jgi:hypothetical protein
VHRAQQVHFHADHQHQHQLQQLHTHLPASQASTDASGLRPQPRPHPIHATLLQARRQEAQLRAAEARLAELRNEMLLREDNYNKVFKNGSAGSKVLDVANAMSAKQGVMDWMLKKTASGRSGTGTTGRLSSGSRDSKGGGQRVQLDGEQSALVRLCTTVVLSCSVRMARDSVWLDNPDCSRSAACGARRRSRQVLC